MPRRQIRANTAAPDDLTIALEKLAAELELPTAFSPEVLADVGESRAAARMPHDHQTAQPHVTIDPPGARDLDQALHIARDGDGFRVRYAIASLGTFVRPGGPLDQEVRRRATTVYGPTGSFPLHPESLSAGAASLLPGQVTPSCLWDLRLDSSGEMTSANVTRAMVRSRAQLTYEQVQAALDGGARLGPDVPSDMPALLVEVGSLRQALEIARGAVSLDLPEQVVEKGPDGRYVLGARESLPIEGHNAQISLLTGMAAAEMMTSAGVGILRTLPDADPRDLRRLKLTARGLGIDWPDDVAYPDLVRSVSSSTAAGAAFLNEATTLFRGAGYLALGATGSEDEGVNAGGEGKNGKNGKNGTSGRIHAAIAAEYAHVTAPLRRLVDRYGLETCLALCADEPVPTWVTDALGDLPSTMGRGGQRAGRYESGAINVMEALVLEGRENEEFSGVVVDVDEDDDRGETQIVEPPVRARLDGSGLELGAELTVRLAEANVVERRVTFEVA
ncbi:MAG: RNB domain-containing ribonuclease [Actinomycetaceae bacterium]